MAERCLIGVRFVHNEVTVAPEATSGEINTRNERALERSAEVNAEGIFVVANDGRVTLRGSVRLWAEREEAERAAWAAPGAYDVDNQIVVGL